MESSNVKIPLQVQLWLLEQSGYFLKAKLDDRKYEAACVLFEKLLCGYDKKELKGKLQVVYSDLIRQLQLIKRWDFVQAACPFVIQCCAQLLTNRTNLGMSDRLSVAATKLLLTAHWCFLEAPTECGLDPASTILPIKTIELFIQTLIPCANCIREEDLNFSLSCGLCIWQPLWNHSCPNIPSFKRPVFLEECKAEIQARSTESSFGNHSTCYFDVAVLRCLMSLYLSEEGLAWCLIYLLQHLQEELLLYCDISDSWPSIKRLRHNTRRNISVQHSVPLFISQMNEKQNFSSASFDVAELPSATERDKNSENLEPIYLPSEYETWISKEGRVRHSAILDIISKVTKTASLKICETLLYMLHLLLELGAGSVVTETDEHGQIDVGFELVVNCLLDLITMIGCDNNDSGIRGSKGQSLRILAHDMFAKLQSRQNGQLGLLLELYIRKKSVPDILNFMHSFTGFCFGGKFSISPIPQHGRPSIGDIGSAHSSIQSSVSYGNTSESKERNEESLMKWIAIPLLQKLSADEKVCKEEYKDLVSKLMSYIKSHHHKALRKMVMNGILKSFSKSQDTKAESRQSVSGHPKLERIVRQPKTLKAPSPSNELGKPHQKPRSNTTFDVTSPDTGGIHKRAKKHILSRMKGMSVDNIRDSITDSNGHSSNTANVVITKTNKTSSPSISKASGSNKFKFFSKNTKRSRLGSVVYSPLGVGDSSSVFTEDKALKPKQVNLIALNEGMRQFRFITYFSSPGHVPEVALIGAMMDLKAPVLSRAALLLECCHYVHCCNKRDWNQNNRPDFASIKDAAMMFYKWGIALGKKLDEQVEREAQENTDLNGKKIEQNEASYLNEGDVASISTDCPYGIKLLACQLLLEITAFLRDNYITFLTSRDRSLTNASRSTAENRKISSVSLYKVKTSNKPHAMPVIAVQDELEFPMAPKRKISGYQGLSTSPKYQRKLSRRTSKAHFLQSEKHLLKLHKDNSHITSSFDEDDDIPVEATDFPWMEGVVAFIKIIQSKTSQPNQDMPLVKLEKSWRKLNDAFLALYKPKKEEKGWSARRSALFQESSIFADPDEKKEVNPILDYIRVQLSSMQHAPFSVLCKAAVVTDRMNLCEAIPCAWEMLLHPDQCLALNAAAVVLVAAYQLDSYVKSFIKKEMNKSDANDRAKAILRFGILWKYRFHVWGRFERNAHATIRVPPPKIEYTLPSPLIGRDPPSTPDAPWIAGSPFPEEAAETSGVQFEWYYDEEKRIEAKAKRRVEKLSELRRNYHLRTVPLSREADIQSKKKIEDDVDDDTWTVVPPLEQDAEEAELFPAAVCAVVLDLIKLLDDTALDCTGQAVCNLAYKTIWQCLVDDPDLFFRTVYEKITKTDKQEEVLLALRKLCKHMPNLPPVAGTLLFNNLTGVIMYHNRTNKPGCQERVAAVLSVLWQVVPSVSNLFLKDMKQILRKEYCDSIFMITASVPGVKDIRVSYQKQMGKFEVSEGMTFAKLVGECQNFFETNEKPLVLLDKHSGALMDKDRMIKDHLIQKRGFPTPLLKLETMENHVSFKQRQDQAFLMKITEIARLNLCGKIFSTLPSQKHVTFIYTELFKQSTFPRKAIGYEFDLCHGRGLARELSGLDVILKDNWVKFICSLLEHLAESIATVEENEMFLNVLNGALLLLCEDVVILRTCLAGFINLSRHFGKIFSVNGYHCILPTILRVYSHHQDNSLVVAAIEFTISQFLILHQSPFILQMFASAAPILQSEITSQLYHTNNLEQIPSNVFFNLLQSLDRKVEDQLDILSLVHGEKPIKPADPACKIETIEFSLIDVAIRLAVTVIACRPDSLRGVQMLAVLSTIVPHYFVYLRQKTEKALLDDSVDNHEVFAKELKQLRMLVSYMKVVLDSAKHLCSPFREEFNESTDSDSPFDDETMTSKPGLLSWNWWSGLFGNVRSWLGFNSERRNLHEDTDRVSVSGDENPMSYDKRCALNKFFLPRMYLLYLVSDFVTNCGTRARQLKDNVRRRVPFPDVIIERAQASILTSVMVSLLSLAPKNHEVLSNIGLQRFMLDALAAIKWTGEKEMFFRQIIDKVNRLLQRIVNRPDFPDSINWNALEMYFRGINFTICKQKELSAVPQIKELVDWSIQLILSERFDIDCCQFSLSFATTAAKLAARLIQVNPRVFSLSVVCADYNVHGNLDCVERFLLYWLLPLCFRLGTGRYDYPQLSAKDIQYALCIILSFLSPNTKSMDSGLPRGSITSIDLQSDVTFTNIRCRKNSTSFVITSEMYKILFLGLKILIVAFEDKFGPHWRSTAEIMEQLLENNRNEPSIWDFFHFIIEHRSPLLVHLLPIVAEKVTEDENLSGEIRSHKTRIERDLWKPGACPCKGYVLRQLLDELTDMTQRQAERERLTTVLASPPQGRMRSYSTHNDRAMKLLELDQQWKNYDQETNPGIPSDQLDGDAVIDKPLKRKRSSKRVTLMPEPVVMDEASVIKSLDREESVKKESVHRKPALKRQSAEEHFEDNNFYDNEIKESPSAVEHVENFYERYEDHHSSPSKNRTFERQRYDLIRRDRGGLSTRSKKREKWRRQHSSRYKQKMQSQVSFDEEEEENQSFESEMYFSMNSETNDPKLLEEDTHLGDIHEQLHVNYEHATLSPSNSSDSPLICYESTSHENNFPDSNQNPTGAEEITSIQKEASDLQTLNYKHVVYI